MLYENKPQKTFKISYSFDILQGRDTKRNEGVSAGGVQAGGKGGDPQEEVKRGLKHR